MSRLVDSSNQYHLWCFQEGIGIGFSGRFTTSRPGITNAKQRPLPADWEEVNPRQHQGDIRIMKFNTRENQVEASTRGLMIIPDPRMMMVLFMQDTGTPLDLPKVVIDSPFQPSADGETDCWAHAWQWALDNDAEYWEGVCWPSDYTIANHAWCVKDGKIIEVEAKYAGAARYVGTAITEADSAMAEAIWDATGGPGPMGRDSVIETTLVAAYASMISNRKRNEAL